MKNNQQFIIQLCITGLLVAVVCTTVLVYAQVLPLSGRLSALVSRSNTVAVTPLQPSGNPAIDLREFTLVLDENFDTDLNIYNGKTGLWNVDSRRENLVTNGPQSVFLSNTTKTTTGALVGIHPFRTTSGILHIESGVIPATKKAAVADALRLVGQADSIPKVNYYTGMLNMHDTLGQAFTGFA